MRRSQNPHQKDQNYFPRNRHNSRSYGYNHFYDSPEKRRLRALAAALVEQERMRRNLIDTHEPIFRERQLVLEKQRIKKEELERERKRTSVAAAYSNEKQEEEAIGGFRGMDSRPALPNMLDNRPSPSTFTTRGGNGYPNLFHISRDGNHETEDFPHQKPMANTEPEAHSVPPDSAYAFIPNPDGGGFGDLQGAVLNSSNRVDNSGECAKSEGAKNEGDGPALYEGRRGPNGCMHLHKIRIGTKENVTKPRMAKGAMNSSDIQSTVNNSSVLGHNPSNYSYTGEGGSVGGMQSKSNMERREQHELHLQDTHPYRVVIDNEGGFHLKLYGSKQQTGTEHSSIPHSHSPIPERQTPIKPIESKRQEDVVVHDPDDAHLFLVEIGNEGYLPQTNHPERCNSSESSFYHQKLMEKEMRKYDYVTQERTKHTKMDSKETGENLVRGNDDVTPQPNRVDNHTTTNRLKDHVQEESLINRDDDSCYEVPHALVPEYRNDKPHPYEFVRRGDGNLHSLQEESTKTAKVQDVKEATTPTNLTYRYIKNKDGILHRSIFDESASHLPVLVTGLEDASDSESEDVFDDSKHTLRPRIGEWIEPEGEAELQKTERLRANNAK